MELGQRYKQAPRHSQLQDLRDSRREQCVVGQDETRGLLHFETASIKLCIIHGGNGSIGFRRLRERDETETLE